MLKIASKACIFSLFLLFGFSAFTEGEDQVAGDAPEETVQATDVDEATSLFQEEIGTNVEAGSDRCSKSASCKNMCDNIFKRRVKKAECKRTFLVEDMSRIENVLEALKAPNTENLVTIDLKILDKILAISSYPVRAAIGQMSDTERKRFLIWLVVNREAANIMSAGDNDEFGILKELLNTKKESTIYSLNESIDSFGSSFMELALDEMNEGVLEWIHRFFEGQCPAEGACERDVFERYCNLSLSTEAEEAYFGYEFFENMLNTVLKDHRPGLDSLEAPWWSAETEAEDLDTWKSGTHNVCGVLGVEAVKKAICADIFRSRIDRSDCEEFSTADVEDMEEVFEILENPDEDDLDGLDHQALELLLDISTDPLETAVSRMNRREKREFLFWLVENEEAIWSIAEEEDEFEILGELFGETEEEIISNLNRAIDYGDSFVELALDEGNEEALDWIHNFFGYKCEQYERCIFEQYYCKLSLNTYAEEAYFGYDFFKDVLDTVLEDHRPDSLEAAWWDRDGDGDTKTYNLYPHWKSDPYNVCGVLGAEAEPETTQ